MSNGTWKEGLGAGECVEEDESESALPVMRETTWTEARDHTLSQELTNESKYKYNYY